jgi:N-acetyl-alpha-D-glucosaminyl L-malate synthase BshA
MKIGIVCYPSIGGSGIVASELGKGLIHRGHEIHFFSYDLPHRLIGDGSLFTFHHVDVPIYPVFRFPPYTLALATKLAEAAEQHQLEVIHVHYAIPHSTSALLAKLMSCHYNRRDLKIITTLHGTDIDLVGWEPNYRAITEYSINSSDAVTAVSEYLKLATQEKFKVTRDIRVIYNPIDTSVFHPAPETPSTNGQRVRTILHISNFRPVKRVQDAVKILDLVRNHLPVRLVFLGDGPDRSVAEKTARQLGVQDRVVFEGTISNIEEWLRRGDLLLSTSSLESFGMSIAEAMASGLPVVAYRVGGIPEVVEDGVQGRLVEPGDVCGAAKAVAEILTNPTLSKTYGRNARERIESKFKLELVAEQYERLYQEVLDGADMGSGPSNSLAECGDSGITKG